MIFSKDFTTLVRDFNTKIKMYGQLKRIDVQFDYKETCNHVYKTFAVYINGKKSNIVGLKKYLHRYGFAPSILGANTYFWNPALSASNRRRNEERHNAAVSDYFLSEGFHLKNSTI